MLDRIFLDYSIRKLTQGAGRIEECLARLNEDQIWARESSNQNAIGNLVLHLCGNVRQWILSGVGGAPSERDRDAEFAARAGSGLNDELQAVVREAVAVIGAQTAESLERRLLIQNYDLVALEAIYHVVEHFAGHAGQIIFATKMLTGEDLGFYKHLKYASYRAATP